MEEMNFAAIAFVGSVRVTNCYFEPEIGMWPLRPPQKKRAVGEVKEPYPRRPSNCNQKDVGVARMPLHLCPVRYFVSRPLVPSAYRRLRSAPSILTVGEPSGG